MKTTEGTRAMNIAKKLKKEGKEVNIENISIASMFVSGGTITDNNILVATIDAMEEDARSRFRRKNWEAGNGISGLAESIYVATYMNRLK